MVKVTYNKSQMDNFRNQLEDAKRKMFEGARQIISASIMDVATTAKQPGYVPYLTGNLRRSITYSLTLNSGGQSIVVGLVGTNVEYARIQEMGGNTGRNHTTHITGKWYLSRAVKDNTQKIKDRFMKINIVKGKL